MNAKKLGIGAGLAGGGVLAARSLGPKLHEHCQTMCSEKFGGVGQGRSAGRASRARLLLARDARRG